MSINLYETPLITAYFYVLTFIFGTVFGSFINCQAWRIAHKEPWWTGRSHCATCNHPLSGLDLIPVFSYLALKGKCRYCGEKISPRYMLTELLLGLAFVGVLFHYGTFDIRVVRDLGLVCALLGLSLVDLETYEIPDGYIIFGSLWWLACSIFKGITTLVTGAMLDTDDVNTYVHAVLNRGLEQATPASAALGIARVYLPYVGAGFAIAAFLLVLSLIMDKILGKESMGGGDIKLLFMTNLYLGLANGFFTLILACIIGLIFVSLLKKNKIPFGPSISIATYFGLMVGPFVVNWYLGLF